MDLLISSSRDKMGEMMQIMRNHEHYLLEGKQLKTKIDAVFTYRAAQFPWLVRGKRVEDQGEDLGFDVFCVKTKGFQKPPTSKTRGSSSALLHF